MVLVWISSFVILSSLLACSGNLGSSDDQKTPPNDAVSRSQAADWVINEQIGLGCASGRGRVAPNSYYEIDLNGDGREDFLFSHQGMECEIDPGKEDEQSVGSLYCGRLCSVQFYLRDAKGLLNLKNEYTGRIENVDLSGEFPVISSLNADGSVGEISWNGREFE